MMDPLNPLNRANKLAASLATTATSLTIYLVISPDLRLCSLSTNATHVNSLHTTFIPPFIRLVGFVCMCVCVCVTAADSVRNSRAPHWDDFNVPFRGSAPRNRMPPCQRLPGFGVCGVLCLPPRIRYNTVTPSIVSKCTAKTTMTNRRHDVHRR